MTPGKGTKMTPGKGTKMLMVACVAVAAACSTTVSGTPRPEAARDAGAPMVAPAGLERLLLSDAEMSGVLGVPGLSTYKPYTGITPPEGETYSDATCAETMYNTMWTAFDGSGYTGGAGRKISEPGDKPEHDVDQGVVSFPDADVASRFVVRTVLGWDRCADVHFSATTAGPNPRTDFYTLGFSSMSGDIATLINTAEGGEGYVLARAITSRSNVVIDVYVAGKAMTTDRAASVVKAIANKMPH